MILKIFLLLLWFPYTITGTVTYVSDGDTFHLIKEDGEKIKVRVNGVDCPESTQAFGLEAKEFVINEIKNKKVQIIVTEIDYYGRSIADVKYYSKDLSEELLKHGFAWHFKKYNKDPGLAALEVEAIKNKVGLWSDFENAVPPWEYRRNKGN